MVNESDQELISRAREALEKSYSPFSGIAVGAAVRTARGVYLGANIENSSYGLTVCAERVAIFSAVLAEGASLQIEAVAVVNSKGIGTPPCGACRQVMAEFSRTARVIYQDQAIMRSTTVADLLPSSFGL